MSIEVNDVVASYYGDLDILRGISIKADRHKVTSIIGPNGSGKSTLLKTIFGFLKPKRGTITFDGERITGVNPHALPMKGLTYVPQRRTIFPYLTVHENLKMGAWTHKRKKEEVKEGIDQVYARFPSLKAKSSLMSGKLSGGQQRMLELARALVISPKTILVDEPSAGLAPKVASELYQKLDELREQKTTILLVDQNVKSALELCDYVYVFKMGQVHAGGAKAEFDEKILDLVREWLV